MVSCEQARLGGTANASFDFVTWLELGVPFGQRLTLKRPGHITTMTRIVLTQKGAKENVDEVGRR